MDRDDDSTAAGVWSRVKSIGKAPTRWISNEKPRTELRGLERMEDLTTLPSGGVRAEAIGWKRQNQIEGRERQSVGWDAELERGRDRESYVERMAMGWDD